MKISDAYPSKFLEGKGLEGDLSLTIKRVDIETVGQGEDANEKPVVYFSEINKGLVLNKTNANTISNLHGDDTDEWHGKRITLFPTEVDFQGRQVMSIRVRLRAPTNGQVSTAPKDADALAAKKAAWVKFKECNPGQNDAALAAKLTAAVTKVFNTSTDKLTGEQWKQLADQDFDVFAGQPSELDDCPF